MTLLWLFFCGTVAFFGELSVAGDLPARGEYLGCYKESRTRQLEFPKSYLVSATSMTRETCINKCVEIGTAYAAINYGRFCKCWDYYGRYGKAAKDSECNKPCTGDKKQKCGSYMYRYNSVFATGVPAPKLNYVGCFIDKDWDRDRSNRRYRTSSSYQTPYQCYRICKLRNNKYFGTQNGKYCVCSNEVGKHGKADEGECNKPCSGRIEVMCGGNLRTSFYETAEAKEKPAEAPEEEKEVGTTLPAGAEYLGCFKENKSPFLDFPRVSGFFKTSMTRERCINTCVKQGAVYAAMSEGIYCFCWDYYGRHGKALKESECNIDCSAEKTHKCGGKLKNRNSVFATGVPGSIEGAC